MKKTVGVCLVGAGRAGKVHAHSLVHHVPNGELVGMIDPNVEALNATADEFGIEPRFTSLEEAVDRLAFDAVVITTPTFTHAALAISAARANKHSVGKADGAQQTNVMPSSRPARGQRPAQPGYAPFDRSSRCLRCIRLARLDGR
jgi:hypothetical protein